MTTSAEEIRREAEWGMQRAPSSLTLLCERLGHLFRINTAQFVILANPEDRQGRHHSLHWLRQSAYCLDRQTSAHMDRDRVSGDLLYNGAAIDIPLPPDQADAIYTAVRWSHQEGRLPDVAEVSHSCGHAYLHIGLYRDATERAQDALFNVIKGAYELAGSTEDQAPPVTTPGLSDRDILVGLAASVGLIAQGVQSMHEELTCVAADVAELHTEKRAAEDQADTVTMVDVARVVNSTLFEKAFREATFHGDTTSGQDDNLLAELRRNATEDAGATGE